MKNILVKPIITEKSELLSDKNNQYSFVVNKKANKIEIGKAVAQKFNVEVLSVNTAIIPAKEKVRQTKTAIMKGLKPAYKKAVVTLAEGDVIDFYDNLG